MSSTCCCFFPAAQDTDIAWYAWCRRLGRCGENSTKGKQRSVSTHCGSLFCLLPLDPPLRTGDASRGPQSRLSSRTMREGPAGVVVGIYILRQMTSSPSVLLCIARIVVDSDCASLVLIPWLRKRCPEVNVSVAAFSYTASGSTTSVSSPSFVLARLGIAPSAGTFSRQKTPCRRLFTLFALTRWSVSTLSLQRRQ